jgi:hypothetical protein
MSEKRYYGTRELADLSGLTQERVRQLVAGGEIQGQKVSRDWVIERDEALRWLSERNQERPDAK